MVDVGEGPLPLIRECGQSPGTEERGSSCRDSRQWLFGGKGGEERRVGR